MPIIKPCSICGIYLGVGLEGQNVFVMISVKYSNYNYVFISDSAVEVPKHTNINNDPIDLVSDLLSQLSVLQYYSSTR